MKKMSFGFNFVDMSNYKILREDVKGIIASVKGLTDAKKDIGFNVITEKKENGKEKIEILILKNEKVIVRIEFNERKLGFGSWNTGIIVLKEENFFPPEIEIIDYTDDVVNLTGKIHSLISKKLPLEITPYNKYS